VIQTATEFNLIPRNNVLQIISGFIFGLFFFIIITVCGRECQIIGPIIALILPTISAALIGSLIYWIINNLKKTWLKIVLITSIILTYLAINFFFYVLMLAAAFAG